MLAPPVREQPLRYGLQSGSLYRPLYGEHMRSRSMPTRVPQFHPALLPSLLETMMKTSPKSWSKVATLAVLSAVAAAAVGCKDKGETGPPPLCLPRSDIPALDQAIERAGVSREAFLERALQSYLVEDEVFHGREWARALNGKTFSGEWTKDADGKKISLTVAFSNMRVESRWSTGSWHRWTIFDVALTNAHKLGGLGAVFAAGPRDYTIRLNGASSELKIEADPGVTITAEVAIADLPGIEKITLRNTDYGEPTFELEFKGGDWKVLPSKL